jgi:hypothetical protein
MIEEEVRWGLEALARGAAAGGWVRIMGPTDCYIRPGLDGATAACVLWTGLGWIGESYVGCAPLVLHLPEAGGWWDTVRALQDAERQAEEWVVSGPTRFGAAQDAPGWYDIPAGPREIMPLRRLARVLSAVDLVILELRSAMQGHCWMPTINSRPLTNGTGVPVIFFSLTGAIEAAELVARQEVG